MLEDVTKDFSKFSADKPQIMGASINPNQNKYEENYSCFSRTLNLPKKSFGRFFIAMTKCLIHSLRGGKLPACGHPAPDLWVWGEAESGQQAVWWRNVVGPHWQMGRKAWPRASLVPKVGSYNHTLHQAPPQQPVAVSLMRSAPWSPHHTPKSHLCTLLPWGPRLQHSKN